MTAPLALTMRQAEIIRDAANKLAPNLRDRFRDHVDDILLRGPKEEFTIRSNGDGEARTFSQVADGAVQRAISWTLRDLRDAAA